MFEATGDDFEARSLLMARTENVLSDGWSWEAAGQFDLSSSGELGLSLTAGVISRF